MVSHENRYLKNVVLLSERKEEGMMNFNDLYKISGPKEAQDLKQREAKIGFDDGTNIQFTSGTTGYPKGTLLSHHNILNNAM